MLGNGVCTIHDVADDERRAFVAAQNAGREGPGRRQLADVVGGDLIEFRIARIGVVAARHHPLLRVGDSLISSSFAKAYPALKSAVAPTHASNNLRIRSSQLSTVE